MDYKLDDDQQMYIDMVRKFVKNEVAPKIMDLEKTHAFPVNIIEKSVGDRDVESFNPRIGERV